MIAMKTMRGRELIDFCQEHVGSLRKLREPLGVEDGSWLKPYGVQLHFRREKRLDGFGDIGGDIFRGCRLRLEKRYTVIQAFPIYLVENALFYNTIQLFDIDK